MNLIRQVIEVMDSDHADELINRYRILCTEKGKEEFEVQKKRMKGKILGEVLKRDMRISPLKSRTRELDPIEAEVNIGMFSFRITETKTVESDWDYLDFLLYYLDKKGILDKVMKPYEAPERVVKRFIYDHLTKPVLGFFKDRILLPVTDKVTDYRWSLDAEELFNVFVRDVVKEKLLLNGGDIHHETGGADDDS